jgi:hypothetical protein
LLEDEATRRAFMDPTVFGTAVQYVRAGGAATALTGIFSAPHARRAQGGGPGVSTLSPTLSVFAADLPAGARQGDAVVIDAVGYVVRDLEPDGSGLVRLTLERN